jgi:hypothetical protein
MARGFRPRKPGDVPTLGWQVLDWTFAMLPSPTIETEPFRFTDEQARRVLRIYELDPMTGERLYSRVSEEEAKGWGKSPFAAALIAAEFCGPVRFGGWDANGQPVGVPWGWRGGFFPWIQIAGVSEDQTNNTWNALFGLATRDGGRAADTLKLDVGRTLIRRYDMPQALIERVTASSRSREGQPITHVVADEPQLWKPGDGGDELARTILRNLTKTDGWAHFTGNAPLIGEHSVAETYGPAPDALLFATRPVEEPLEEWTDGQKLEALEKVYHDVPWIKLRRVMADISAETMPWQEAQRFFFNWRPRSGASDWMDPAAWTACAKPEIGLRESAPTYACVRIGRDHRSAAVAYAQRIGDGAVLRCRIFEASDLVAGVLDFLPIENFLRTLQARYPAKVNEKLPGFRQPVARPGPEVVFDGAWFERSAQALASAGMVLVDQPNSQARISPAAETLYGLVRSHKLAHEGDAALERQILDVTGEPDDTGWKIAEASKTPAAIASMIAVHRAMTEERPAARRLATFTTF